MNYRVVRDFDGVIEGTFTDISEATAEAFKLRSREGGVWKIFTDDGQVVVILGKSFDWES